MRACCYCGRPIGEAFERGECTYPGGFACGESSSHELRRELADAKAEVERLRAERDDYRSRLERIRPVASIEPRSAFDVMAERAGPLPTAVLADSPDVEPIESLGPVPVRAGEVDDMDDGYRAFGEARATRVLAWLVRDALRRGAKLDEP